MNFLAVVDTSAFIWDRYGFERDASIYYELTEDLMTFIEVFRNERPKIILRKELLEEMINGFPCDIVQGITNFRDLCTSIYLFLGNLNEIIEFEGLITDALTSIPNIAYDYYNNTVKREIKYLISEMHSTHETVIYFTFKSIWQSDVQLQTQLNYSLAKSYETIIHSGNEIINFFSRFKPLFEHNPKHKKHSYIAENGEEVSPFSCFFGRDKSLPQKLLSTAVKDEGSNKYYNYDDTNGTFVCFYAHTANKYHGFDIKLENVPRAIRKKFHKK
jgi:hypothetical protein